jgi:hypothetical protein
MRRKVEETYDDMKAAMESGKAYQTWLDPPPADERVAHISRWRGSIEF